MAADPAGRAGLAGNAARRCLLWSLVAAATAACGAGKGEDTTHPPTDGDVFLDGTPPDTGLDPDAACGAIREAATLTPLNMFIMLDKSSSMAGPKWNGARAGLAAFLNDKDSAGIRVAINFFPRPPDATPSCDQAAYKTPKVPFDLLPANAAPILDAVDKTAPDGFNTPIYPALGGAILGAIDQVKARPGDRGAVLLVTDGEPQGPAPTCGGVNPEDVAVIADLAATGAKFSPPIVTFVVGLPGINVATADKIAAAGGSDKAVLVTDPTKVETQFQEALATVRGRTLPCEYPLPTKVTKGEISFGLVNVAWTTGAGATKDLAQSKDCSGPGWRYDDPAKPTKILLCPATCAEIHADYKAKIQILLGCKTIVR